MGMQFYASPEQIMRDRSEYARKGIARGRSVIVMSAKDGIVFVAENPSKALHKISELYDRIGFAAVGKYNEFENLRVAGIRYADMQGFTYDRRDVTGSAIANTYAQYLGAIFTEQSKPYEVEVCVAEVAVDVKDDQLYRLTYDGSVADEPGFVAMGGQSEAIGTALKESHSLDLSLQDAVKLAFKTFKDTASDSSREPGPDKLEVAVLDRHQTGRVFRRITGKALTDILEENEK